MTKQAQRGTQPVPEHTHGSAYYYNLGCDHPKCRAAASKAKKGVRSRRYDRRVMARYTVPGTDRVEMRLIHPDLAAVTSTKAARHGTPNGRREYGCDCDLCRQAGKGQKAKTGKRTTTRKAPK